MQPDLPIISGSEVVQMLGRGEVVFISNGSSVALLQISEVDIARTERPLASYFNHRGERAVVAHGVETILTIKARVLPASDAEMAVKAVEAALPPPAPTTRGERNLTVPKRKTAASEP